MNAPLPPRGFMLLITDTTGPLSSAQAPGSWRAHDEATLAQLTRTLFPGLTVLAVEWATEPKLYACSGDVLLVKVPGTHEVKAPKPKPAPKPRKAVVEVDVAGPHDSYRPRHGYGELKADMALRGPKVFAVPAPPLDNVVVINTCTTCGTAYTAATFAQLKFMGAKDITEDGVVIHENWRRCGCGSTRMTMTTRLLEDKR